WRTEILNSFILIGQRRISNGPIESINGRIKILLKTSLKYKNFERLRSRIMYCINKDSLPLLTNKKKTNKELGEKRGNYKKNKK
ncbi:MAG: transposase, partial [Coprobacillus sp.]